MLRRRPRPHGTVGRGSAPPEGWGLLHVCLAIVLLTYAWRVHDIVQVLGKLQIVSLATLGALGLFLLGRYPARLSAVARHPVYRWALAMLVWMVLSVPGGVYPGNSFRFILEDHAKTFLVFTILACSLPTLRHIEILVLAHLLGAVIYSVNTVLNFRVGADGRLHGLVYYDANDIGLLLVCTLPLAVYFFRSGADWRIRLFAAAAVAAPMLVIVKSGSRGTFLGLAISGAFLLFTFRGLSRSARLGAVVVATVLMVALAPAQYWKQMSTLLNPTEDYNWAGNSRAGRMEIWKRGWGYMKERPIFGVGVYSFWVAEGTLSEYAKLQQFGVGLKWSAPHNSFVQAGGELGFPGLAFYLLLIYSALRTARRIGSIPWPRGARAPPLQALGQALAVSMVGYAVTATFLTQAYSAYFYTLLAMIIALSRVAAPAEPVPMPSASDRASRTARAGRASGRGRRAYAVLPEPA